MKSSIGIAFHGWLRDSLSFNLHPFDEKRILQSMCGHGRGGGNSPPSTHFLFSNLQTFFDPHLLCSLPKTSTPRPSQLHTTRLFCATFAPAPKWHESYTLCCHRVTFALPSNFFKKQKRNVGADIQRTRTAPCAAPCATSAPLRRRPTPRTPPPFPPPAAAAHLCSLLFFILSFYVYQKKMMMLMVLLPILLKLSHMVLTRMVLPN